MEHPDDEVLTQFALDDPLAVDAATLVHISDCDRCTDDIQEIQRVVDAALAAGGRADLRTIVPPSPSVWDQVLVAVGGVGQRDVAEQASPEPPAPGAHAASHAASPAEPAEPGEPGEPVWLFEQPGEIAVEHAVSRSDFDQPADRRTLWQVAVAAAVGLIIGAGTAWLIAGGDSAPSSTSGPGAQSSTTSESSAGLPTTALTGVDGHVTSGQIALVEGDGQAPHITVTLDTLDRDKGFLEAWLLNSGSGGLVALGILDGTSGTFSVPPALNLSKYDQVEVSREPFDGDPAHSTTTLARGPVPVS
jgi:hypothetical protein